jgi:hypothetical protein
LLVLLELDFLLWCSWLAILVNIVNGRYHWLVLGNDGLHPRRRRRRCNSCLFVVASTFGEHAPMSPWLLPPSSFLFAPEDTARPLCALSYLSVQQTQTALLLFLQLITICLLKTWTYSSIKTVKMHSLMRKHIHSNSLRCFFSVELMRVSMGKLGASCTRMTPRDERRAAERLKEQGKTLILCSCFDTLDLIAMYQELFCDSFPMPFQAIVCLIV